MARAGDGTFAAVVCGAHVRVGDAPGEIVTSGAPVLADAGDELNGVRLAACRGERVASGSAARHERRKRGAVHNHPGGEVGERKGKARRVRRAAHAQRKEIAERTIFKHLLLLLRQDYTIICGSLSLVRRRQGTRRHTSRSPQIMV